MAKFTGTFIFLIEREYEFETVADTKEEAIKKIKGDPLEYIKGIDPVYERGGHAANIEFNEVNNG